MTDIEICSALDYCYAQLHPAIVMPMAGGNIKFPQKVSPENLERIEQTLLQLVDECVCRGWWEKYEEFINRSSLG